MTDEENRLCKYVDLRFEEHDKRIKILFTAQEKASELSAKALESKLVELNDVRHRFLPRTEYELQHARVVDAIQELREFRAELKGKASQSALIVTLAISLIGIAFGIIDMFKP